MRLAYDHQIFCLQKVGGISRYFCKLIEQLNKLDQTTRVFAPIYRNQYLQQLPRQSVQGRQVVDYPRYCADLAVAVNGYVSRPQLKAWQPELVHETYFSKVRSGPTSRPSVVTVFDMISELGLEGAPPSFAQMKATNKYAAVSRADYVVCISEQTRQDLIRLFNIQSEKVLTIHLGCDQERAVAAAQESDESTARLSAMLSARLSSSRPYFLYVGLRQGYKNFSGLLRSIAASSRLKSSFDVIAFGGGTFTSDEQALIDELKFAPEQIEQISGDDLTLTQLYQQASAFVYPSLYEGFGLPPLEAMLHHCPVVSSQVSAMPEVLGDAAEFFDPNQIDSIAQALERVAFSNDRRQELITKGVKRLKAFTWQACAERHLLLYQSLAASYVSRQ
jgi:glycosyltransferase involved in cell wall biosynthesis